MSINKMYEKIIVALDFPTVEQARALVREFKGLPVKYKLGMETYTLAGPDLLREIRDNGGYVFLDLKYKDILNTVKGASRSASSLGSDLFNVHVFGARKEKLEAAKEGAIAGNSENPSKVIGVTLLTDETEYDLRMFRIYGKPEEYVSYLTYMAKRAGLDGVVSSAQELPNTRYIMGEKATLVTPAIKSEWAKATEQERITTPTQAIENGADLLVIGRQITQPGETIAKTSRKALEMTAEEMYKAMPNYGVNRLDANKKIALDNAMVEYEKFLSGIEVEMMEARKNKSK